MHAFVGRPRRMHLDVVCKNGCLSYLSGFCHDHELDVSICMKILGLMQLASMKAGLTVSGIITRAMEACVHAQVC